MSGETKPFKKPLIWVSIAFFIVVLIMGFIIFSQSESLEYYNERIDKLYESHEYKCDEGLRRICIDEDKYSVEIGEDETYAVCDTDRREYAVCLEEDKSWTQCHNGESATCVDWDVERIIKR